MADYERAKAYADYISKYGTCVVKKDFVEEVIEGFGDVYHLIVEEISDVHCRISKEQPNN